MNKEIDVRDVLPAIRVPTLILHGTDDTVVPIEGARYMADRIPGARLVEVPGAGHLAVGEADGHVRRDGTVPDRGVGAGGWEERRAGSRARDRALHGHRRLERAAGGARRPRAGASCSSAITRSSGASWRATAGVEVDTAGDGFFASFDGPRGGSGARAPSSRGAASSGWRCVPGCTPASASSWTARSAGIAVHTGARVASRAARRGAGSRTVKDLVAGSGIPSSRGTHELKGVPGEWELFAADRVSA